MTSLSTSRDEPIKFNFFREAFNKEKLLIIGHSICVAHTLPKRALNGVQIASYMWGGGLEPSKPNPYFKIYKIFLRFQGAEGFQKTKVSHLVQIGAILFLLMASPIYYISNVPTVESPVCLTQDSHQNSVLSYMEIARIQFYGFMPACLNKKLGFQWIV